MRLAKRSPWMTTGILLVIAAVICGALAFLTPLTAAVGAADAGLNGGLESKVIITSITDTTVAPSTTSSATTTSTTSCSNPKSPNTCATKSTTTRTGGGKTTTNTITTTNLP
jgi:hypothetical protein